MRCKSVVLLLCMGTAGCGGGNSPAPTPTPNPTGIAITASTDLMKLRGSETFSLRATYDNGTTNTVQGTWTSDNSAVAAVDASGRVTAAAAGEATIAATYQGFRATHRLRVVPDYHGRWSGTHRITGCSNDGIFQETNFCGAFNIGDVFVMDMRLTQTRDAVTGTSDLADPPSAVQGSVRMSGHLDLSGAFTLTVETLVINVTLADWESTTTDNAAMTGRFGLVLRIPQLQGSARLDNDLVSFGKISTTPAVFRAPADGRAVQDALRRTIRR